MVGSTTNRNSFNVTSASTAPLSVTYRFDDPSWLQVTYVETDSPTITTLVSGTDYTPGGDGETITGTVTLTDSFLETITSGVLVIARFTPALQELDLQYNTRFPSELTEKQLDWIVMALQDRTDNSTQAGTRAIVLPPNEPPANTNTLQVWTERAGKLQYFNASTGAITTISIEDVAPLILSYYDGIITAEDVLAAISALSPLERFTPPTTSTLGKFGQLAIIPEHVDLEITGTLTPDITGTLLPWKTQNGKIWFSTYGEDPETLTGDAISVLISWTGAWIISVYEFGVVNVSTRWGSFPGAWLTDPYPNNVGTWINFGTTGQPSIATTNEEAARGWINFAPTDTTPNWVESFVEQIPRKYLTPSAGVPAETGKLTAFGDSRTYGTNNSGNSYTTAGRINEAYRWTYLYANSQGRTLTIENLGIPSGKISGTGVDANIWNSTGQLDYDWSGVTVGMLGFNNCDSGTITPEFFLNMEEAFAAFCYRFICDGYAGIGEDGWGNGGAGAGTLHGFTTTGTANSEAVAAGTAASRMPFYYGDPDGARLQVHLTSGEYAEWELPDMRSCGVVLETSNAGGPYRVTVNGVIWAEGNTEYDNVGGNDPAGHMYPRLAFLDGLPSPATIRIECTGAGTVRLQGYEWVLKASTLISGRTAILAGPGGDNINARPLWMMRELCERARAAVERFPNYPIYFADNFTDWDCALLNEPSDISHLTPLGEEYVAEAFRQAGNPIRSANIPRETKADLIKVSALEAAEIARVDMNPSLWATGIISDASLPTGLGCMSLNLRVLNTAGSSVVAISNNNGFGSLLAPLGYNYDYAHWDIPARIIVDFTVSNTSANSIFRVLFGTLYNSAALADLSDKGVGFKIENASLKIQTHDGTTLTNSASIATLSVGLVYRVTIDLDGDGGIEARVNNGQTFSASTAPSSPTATNLRNGIAASATNGADASFAIIAIHQILVARLPNY